MVDVYWDVYLYVCADVLTDVIIYVSSIHSKCVLSTISRCEHMPIHPSVPSWEHSHISRQLGNGCPGFFMFIIEFSGACGHFRCSIEVSDVFIIRKPLSTFDSIIGFSGFQVLWGSRFQMHCEFSKAWCLFWCLVWCLMCWSGWCMFHVCWDAYSDVCSDV
jgi:hypothetical protein